MKELPRFRSWAAGRCHLPRELCPVRATLHHWNCVLKERQKVGMSQSNGKALEAASEPAGREAAPAVSVTLCMPCYNAARYLAESIESVLAQTYPYWELVCVDDGSRDQTWEILQAYAARDARIRLHRLEQNSGSAGRPVAVAFHLARTEFALELDSDDVLEPEYLEKVVKRQQETGAECVGTCYCGYGAEIRGGQSSWSIPDESFDFSQVLTGRQAFGLTLGDWKISLNGMLMKTRHQLTPDELAAVDDRSISSNEYSLRVGMMRSASVAFCRARYCYRVHPMSVSCSPRHCELAWTNKMILQLCGREFGLSSPEYICQRRVYLTSWFSAWQKWMWERQKLARDVAIRCRRSTPLSEVWRSDLPLAKKLFLSLPVALGQVVVLFARVVRR